MFDVKWLFWQTWVLLLLSFLVGAFITWMVFVKPRRRVSALAANPDSAAIRPVAELVGVAVGGSSTGQAVQAPHDPPGLAIPGLATPVLAARDQDGPDLDTPVLGIPVAHGPALVDPAAEAAAAVTQAADDGFGGNSDDTLVLAADVAAGRTPEPHQAGTDTPAGLAETSLPATTIPETVSLETASLETVSPETVSPETAVAEGEPPYGPGSAQARPDGASPGPEYQIKGNRHSMLYHTPDSPYYSRTRPGVWFRTEDDARRAGFHPWNRQARQDAKLPAQSVRGGA